MNKRLYDWDKLLIVGNKFRLRRGRDYACSQSTIVQQIRNAAADKEVRAEIKDVGRAVVVEVKERRQKQEPCACA